jgi:hypothetical protein
MTHIGMPPARRAAVRWRAALLVITSIAMLHAAAARADIYKCTGAQGQVTYSDAPCPGETSVRVDLKEPVENHDPRRPAAAPVPPQAPRPPDLALAAPASLPAGRYELSYSDRQRITTLEQLARNSAAYGEQRQSAALEIHNIRRGVVARMAADDMRKKEQFWADLSSAEPERRRAAAEELVNLYARYP